MTEGPLSQVARSDHSIHFQQSPAVRQELCDGDQVKQAEVAVVLHDSFSGCSGR